MAHSVVQQWLPKSVDSSSKVDISKLTEQHIAIIGSGPAGVRCAQELLKRQPNLNITLYGNEPYEPYNRVKLSSLLAGEVAVKDIVTPLPDETKHPNFKHHTCTLRLIDQNKQTLIDAQGQDYHYDQCVIATGARPHLPNITGIEQTGVYTFRNLNDAEALYARVSRSRHIVVMGGGLLGLEAARALLKNNTHVTLIQQGEYLMNRQLDETAAELLEAKVNNMGIRVITESGVGTIHGEGRVSGITTRSGEHIDCDTVLVCAGIKPNIEIAQHSKINVARGIVVNDQMQTSAPKVYAIGECCEHQGLTYGLVNPGFEQAAIVADVITGGYSHYQGSLEVSQLKVVGESVCSMGEVSNVTNHPQQYEVSFYQSAENIYRKLIIRKGVIVGAVGFGDWPESRRIQEAFQNKRHIYRWQSYLFRINGKLWQREDNDVAAWPSHTTICQCNNVTQGQLVDAINQGYTQLPQLQEFTGASTVCGSCKPLVEQLLGNRDRAKESAWKSLMLSSAIATALALMIAFIPGLTPATTVFETAPLETFWNDGFWKQVTGFTLLGLSLIGLLMSLRKRIKSPTLSKKLGQFAYWRLFHVILGMSCAAILIAHTGLNLGQNFNRLLMFDFLAIVLLGALAGSIISLSHTLSTHHAAGVRRFFNWLHILVTWPLPFLLGTHILTVYYF